MQTHNTEKRLPFSNTVKTTWDMEKTMSYVAKTMSDIIQIISDIVFAVANVWKTETYIWSYFKRQIFDRQTVMNVS